jgi:hypothetical protein
VLFDKTHKNQEISTKIRRAQGQAVKAMSKEKD